MADLSNNDGSPLLKELKPEAVPGYAKAFVIAITIMAIYLAVVLFTSPGKVKKKDKDKHHGSNFSLPKELILPMATTDYHGI